MKIVRGNHDLPMELH